MSAGAMQRPAGAPIGKSAGVRHSMTGPPEEMTETPNLWMAGERAIERGAWQRQRRALDVPSPVLHLARLPTETFGATATPVDSASGTRARTQLAARQKCPSSADGLGAMQ